MRERAARAGCGCRRGRLGRARGALLRAPDRPLSGHPVAPDPTGCWSLGGGDLTGWDGGPACLRPALRRRWLRPIAAYRPAGGQRRELAGSGTTDLSDCQREADVRLPGSRYFAARPTKGRNLRPTARLDLKGGVFERPDPTRQSSTVPPERTALPHAEQPLWIML